MQPIALYARVSTDDQHPEAQLAELRAYAKRRNVKTIEYVDRGVSGRKRRRTALDQMLQAARRQDVSAVVVVRLDRLARSLANMARLGEELQALGVELVSLHEGIDTRTATGRAMFGMCGVFAQLEGDLIRERTVAGLKAARRRGVQLGRPRALDRREHQRVLRLRGSGHSIRAIAERLGVGVATVHRAIKAA
jgi:DNA invertase Pin-like site-specific DNA recombinase